MADEGEAVTLTPRQWDIVMDVLRVDATGPDAADRLGDLRSDVEAILQNLMRQLGRDGIERSEPV